MNMKKEILSEIAIYSGEVEPPEGFEINRESLALDVLTFQAKDSKDFPFSKTLDVLNTYLREHINLKYRFQLISKNIRGTAYKSKETSFPLLNVDPMDLIHSADYTLLYGIEVEKCSVRILYDDNRNTGRVRALPLETNKFILFPSTQTYYIINNNRANSLNFIQTIIYESI